MRRYADATSAQPRDMGGGACGADLSAMRSATALTMSTDGSDIVSRSRVAALCPLRFASSHGRAGYFADKSSKE